MARSSKAAKAGVSAECCAGGRCDPDCMCRSAGVPGNCQVEAIVRVDGRGQMVLPKELREKAGFTPDQRLALVSWTQGDEVCCVTIQPADELAEAVRKAYGPLLLGARSRP
jgi:antitoxin PrlF